MDVVHKVYQESELIKSFSDSCWYDTATPYSWCLGQLQTLKDILLAGHAFTIVSDGMEYHTNTLKDFKWWIKNIFGGGFEEDL
ncbi:MAG: hypothetical protein AAGI07_18085 [Bacteroidota bacterium]